MAIYRVKFWNRAYSFLIRVMKANLQSYELGRIS